MTCEVFEWLKRNWFVSFIALVSCFQLWIINIPVECVKLRNLCICPNEKKTIFFAFWTLECFNSNLHSLTFVSGSDSATFTRISAIWERQVNYNRGIKLIGIFGWCQMTFFFYLLSTARTSRGSNNLKVKVPNIFSIMVWSAHSHRMHHWWRGDWLIIVCLATRITSQSLRPITHTMLTSRGTLCTLKSIMRAWPHAKGQVSR